MVTDDGNKLLDVECKMKSEDSEAVVFDIADFNNSSHIVTYKFVHYRRVNFVHSLTFFQCCFSLRYRKSYSFSIKNFHSRSIDLYYESIARVI